MQCLSHFIIFAGSIQHTAKRSKMGMAWRIMLDGEGAPFVHDVKFYEFCPLSNRKLFTIIESFHTLLLTLFHYRGIINAYFFNVMIITTYDYK